MELIHRLARTRADAALTAARLALGIVMLPHGMQKLLGWFGGAGFAGTLGFFTDSLGIPAVLAVLVILGESLGAVGLIAGFLGRLCAAGIGLIMLGAIRMHADNGFFMNWFGTQAGEGFEFHILALGLAVTVAIGGSGALSADRLLARPPRTEPDSRAGSPPSAGSPPREE